MNYKSILVTGGTGFFGRAYVKSKLEQMEYYSPDQYLVHRLCVFSRSESKQAEFRQELGNDDRVRWFIGDVRDEDRLRIAMDGVDLVIHAAALKRIEAVEYNIVEAVATNVIGTNNVIRAAIDAGVRRVVFLSSDKACNPTTTYGFTKAIAERLILKAYQLSEHALRRPWAWQTMFCACRYGNVAGSTGSIIPTWRAFQARNERTVPVSDPEATRFWMSVDEAVALVDQASQEDMEPGPGRLYIPNDLPAFALKDLAAAMRLTMTETGLVDGEKLHEEMIPGQSSRDAKRLSIDDIRDRLGEL